MVLSRVFRKEIKPGEKKALGVVSIKEDCQNKVIFKHSGYLPDDARGNQKVDGLEREL